MEKIKICYLYAEIMGYSLATINALSAENVDLSIIHWVGDKKLTKFNPVFGAGVNVFERQDLNFWNILNYIRKIKPNLIVVSGWMDLAYLPACLYARFSGIKVAVCIDDQWHNTLRQKIASFISNFKIFNLFFSHAWVCGAPQYHYAKNIGFCDNYIVYDLYSCDTNKYKKINNLKFNNKNFIFVGRFESVKGLDTLIEAWHLFYQNFPNWTLTVIGSGSYHQKLKANSINVKSFLSSDEIIVEAKESTCFILPSVFEPWGVVVHEFAALGLPLIVSDCVGSRSNFVIHGSNGYVFKTGDSISLAEKMTCIANLECDKLVEMSSNSSMLSTRTSPATSAANILSIIRKY